MVCSLVMHLEYPCEFHSKEKIPPYEQIEVVPPQDF